MIKEDFKFSNERNCWVNHEFVVSNEQYEMADWESISNTIKTFLANQDKFKEEENKALIKYAEEIKFFSKEEFEDLDFIFSDARFIFKNKIVEGFVLSYSVKEDGTQKIPWKDLYGIWEVMFIGNLICKTSRTTTVNF